MPNLDIIKIARLDLTSHEYNFLPPLVFRGAGQLINFKYVAQQRLLLGNFDGKTLYAYRPSHSSLQALDLMHNSDGVWNATTIRKHEGNIAALFGYEGNMMTANIEKHSVDVYEFDW